MSINIGGARDVIYLADFLRSPAGSSGTYYGFGFYRAPAADANLDEGSTTQTYGTANISYAAHAFIVAGGAGSASGGSGAVTITVSGTSITDKAVRTAGDTETLVSDITTMTTDAYYETTKKWLGQITFTLDVGATGHTAYSADFNYGVAKYEDYGNRPFTITDFQCTGLAGANDAGFDIELFHHKDTGWTYSAAAFVAGPTAIAKMSTDHSTERQLANGHEFAYKRDDLNEDVEGALLEGAIVRVTTTANAAVEYMTMHLGMRPKRVIVV